MKHRAGLTLVEVLIAIFIMGIGLLAIMTLFPLGILNYRQAMQDDRAGQAAANATAIANAMGLRHDNDINQGFTANPGSTAVYVDPWYWLIQPAPKTVGGVIPRVRPTSWPGVSTNVFGQWFSLLDDYDFDPDGSPIASGPNVTSAGYYTWCYMLRRPSGSGLWTDMSIVIYKGRVTEIIDGETVWPTTPAAVGATTIIIPVAAGTKPPAIRKTGWILDPTTGQFYRVISAVQNTTGSVVMETQLPLRGPVSSIVVMENVVEVIEKGFGL